MTNRTMPSGEMRITSKKLKGNTAKDILRNLKTSIPIVKIASMDPTIWEYLLYTLLSIYHEL